MLIHTISNMAVANYSICSVKGCLEGPRGSVARHGACTEHVSTTPCDHCDMIKHTTVEYEMDDESKKNLCRRDFAKYNMRNMDHKYNPCLYQGCRVQLEAPRNLCGRHRNAQRCTNCKHMVMRIDDYPESRGRLICRFCARIIYDRYFRINRAGASEKLRNIKDQTLTERRERQEDQHRRQLAIAREKNPGDSGYEGSEDEGSDDDFNPGDSDDEEGGNNQAGENEESEQKFNPDDYIPDLDGKEAKEDIDLFEQFSFSSDDEQEDKRQNIKQQSTSPESIANRIRERRDKNIQTRRTKSKQALQNVRIIDISEDD